MLKSLLKNPNTWSTLAGGTVVPLALDYAQHPDQSTFGADTIRDIADGKVERMRALNLGLNSLLGAFGGRALLQGKLKDSAYALGGIFGKDLMLNLQATPGKVNQALDATKGLTDMSKATASNSRNLNILLGLLGAGALATGAVATAKYLTRKDPKSEMGKIKLKLPGSRKDPNTAAEVELPIDMPGMSPTLIEGLNRGVRLQARKNVRANSFKRDPQTGKLVPYEEWKAQQQVNKPTEPQTSDNVIEFPALAKAASSSPGLANLLAKSLGAGVGGTIGALGGGAGAAHLAKHLGAGDTATALTGILGMGAGGLGGVLIGSSAANAVVPPAVTEGDPKAEAQASYANTGSSPAGYTADPDEDFSDEDLDKYASWQDAASSAVTNLTTMLPGGAALAAPQVAIDRAKQLDQQEAQKRRAEQQQADAYMTSRRQPQTQSLPLPQPLTRSSNGLIWGTQQPWNKTASAPPQQGPPRPANQLARRPVTNTLPPSPGLAPAAAKAGAPPTGNLDDLSIKLQGTANDALDMQAKQAYVVDYIAFPADGTKQAYDLSGRMEAQAIMDRIYNEDPSYWPYGLGIPGHDGVYLIRDKMTKQAAGFVGWQQMLEGGRLIGSYSIGILPEYRGHGFAKEAVAKILREKAAGVDEVRSYVMPHNQKSKALAASLGVPVHEEF